MLSALRRRATPVALFVLTLLAIELLDELVFGAREAAWPLIRTDLNLSYAQIGLLLTIPTIVADFIEPALGILADTWKRRLIIVGGGVCFTIGLLLVGFSQSFALLMMAFVLLYPSSGAFVALSQATLMDHQPERHEQNMARWTLAGSLGQLVGPLLLGAVLLLGGEWRTAFVTLAVLSLILVIIMRGAPIRNSSEDVEEEIGFLQGLRNGLASLKRREIWRWLILVGFCNLMLDILLGYLALYFVDVVHVSEEQAGLAIAIWTGLGLLGNIVLIPLLERIRGLTYLRVSVFVSLVLYPAFLIAQPIWLKLVILGLLGFTNAGWYSVLQGQLYSAMPGQSGTVMALGNVTSLVESLLPLGLGLLADHFGLGVSMWFLLTGPLVLLIGLPRGTRSETVQDV